MSKLIMEVTKKNLDVLGAIEIAIAIIGIIAIVIGFIFDIISKFNQFANLIPVLVGGGICLLFITFVISAIFDKKK